MKYFSFARNQTFTSSTPGSPSNKELFRLSEKKRQLRYDIAKRKAYKAFSLPDLQFCLQLRLGLGPLLNHGVDA